MSCNCATSEQIKMLHRKYGVSMKVPKGAKFGYKAKIYLENIFAGILLVFSIPLLFHNVSSQYHNGNNKISLSKFFNLQKNVMSYE